jgi:hypothetical protein
MPPFREQLQNLQDSLLHFDLEMNQPILRYLPKPIRAGAVPPEMAEKPFFINVLLH